MSTPPAQKTSGAKKAFVLVVILGYVITALWLARGVHHHNDAIRSLDDALAKAPMTMADGSPSLASKGFLAGKTAKDLAQAYSIALETNMTLDVKDNVESLRHQMENWRLILAVLHFIGLAWILSAFVWPPIRGLVAGEIQGVIKDMAEAKEEHDMAQADYDAFQEIRNRFDADVEAMRNDERDRGKREAEEIVVSADRAVKVIEAGCQDCLHKALEDARNEVKARLAHETRERVAKIVADRLDDKSRSALMDLGLKQLEEVTWTRS